MKTCDESPRGAVKRRAAHIFPRAANDWYVEPRWVTTALARVEPFRGLVWDPACGAGNIVEALRAAGISAIGTDIVQRRDAEWHAGVLDFLRCAEPLARNIVTNPPYGRARLTEAFIRHALALGCDKLAVFTCIRFLSSASRARGLFSELPPSRIWAIVPRPSCPPGSYLESGAAPHSGTQDYCWIVWSRAARQWPAILRWLDCTEDRDASA